MIPSSLASNFFALSQFDASMLYYVFVYAPVMFPARSLYPVIY